MTDSTRQHYNALPYEGTAFPQTHPARLTAIARLFKLEPPPAPVETGRILELGCANGENLLPLAYELPRATLVGIDHSERQIANATRAAAAIGLSNVSFRAADILAIDDSWGTFNTIICHGVYSWVSDAVRQKILNVCRTRLAPGGIAFISFNVYPGWYEKMTIRELMLFHCARFHTPAEQIAQARGYLKFLAAAALKKESALAALYSSMAKFMETQSDAYIFHEYLEPHNYPFHFHQFAAQLKDNDLQYLADIDVGSAVPRDLSPNVQTTLHQIATDWIAWEQHIDYLTGRTFRQSLVVRAADRAARFPQLDAARDLFFSANLSPMVSPQEPMAHTDPRLFSNDNVGFFNATWTGQQVLSRPKVHTADPLLKNILIALANSAPMPMQLDDLAATVQARLAGRVPAELSAALSDWKRLAVPLLQAAMSQLVELHASPPRLVTTVSQRPQTSALARWQSAQAAPGTPNPTLTNLLHRPMQIFVSRQLLQLADGTRTVPEIIAALANAGTPGDLQTIVPNALGALAKSALLVS